MREIYKGRDKRWWYAYLDETGKSVNRHLFSDRGLENDFVAWLPEKDPSQYEDHELAKLMKRFQAERKREKAQK